MSAYEKLRKRLKQLYVLDGVLAQLSWDASVMMPKGSVEDRGEQIGYLSSLYHKMLVSEKTEELLNDSEAELANSPNNWDKVNLALIRHELIHAKAVPADLVSKIAKESHKCEVKWRKARKNSDFKYIQPKLKSLLNLVKEQAQYKAEALGVSPYQALLDMYDRGRKIEDIDSEFEKLKNFLPTFISKVKAKQNPKGSIAWDYSLKAQKALGKHFMRTLGFDMNKGRLDKSTHPFCGGKGDDIRITTRYNKRDFLYALYGIIHETGHAVYEQNLPKIHKYDFVGHSNGMSIHESQSLFMEKQMARNPAFIEHLHGILHEFFPNIPQYTAQQLQDYILHVEPSFIRVDADEVTYPCHVIARYELEKAMISGELEVADLPTAFNEKVEKLLGIKPKKDSDGCLQDIHWFSGAFGYFPTYTLGAMTAAQIMNKIRETVKVDKALRDGDFLAVTRWNVLNIHSHGSLYNSSKLLEVTTGEKLNSDYFIEHLENRYLKN